MTSVGRGGGNVLKFVTCLHILLFSNRRSIIYCSFLQMGVCGGSRGDWWFVDVIIV